MLRIVEGPVGDFQFDARLQFSCVLQIRRRGRLLDALAATDAAEIKINLDRTVASGSNAGLVVSAHGIFLSSWVVVVVFLGRCKSRSCNCLGDKSNEGRVVLWFSGRNGDLDDLAPRRF